MKVNKADYLYLFVILLIFILSYISKDNYFAIISSVFGMIYTILLGKGKPTGYFFGMVGTISGSILAYTLSLWGNFMLHAFCFFPMEIIGLFAWNKNMNKQEKTVIKTRLNKKETVLVAFLSFVIFVLFSVIFKNTKDSFPILDALITTLSLTGMYLTVKRCYEQWMIWTIVNLTSIVMWFEVFMTGEGVISVLIVRIVYLILGINFFLVWQKDIKKDVEENFAK